MPFVLVIIAALLIVTAWRNSVGALGSALASDLPAFGKWFVALALVGGIGFVPGLKVPSRWLLGLVLLVLFLANWQAVLAGFKDAGNVSSSSAASNPEPAQQYAANPATNPITQAAATGGASSSGSSGSSSGSSSIASVSGFGSDYLQTFEQVATVAALLA